MHAVTECRVHVEVTCFSLSYAFDFHQALEFVIVAQRTRNTNSYTTHSLHTPNFQPSILQVMTIIGSVKSGSFLLFEVKSDFLLLMYVVCLFIARFQSHQPHIVWLFGLARARQRRAQAMQIFADCSIIALRCSLSSLPRRWSPPCGGVDNKSTDRSPAW